MRALALALALAFTGGACAGSAGDDPPGTTGSGGSTGAGGSGTSSNFKLDCSAPSRGTPLLRLLTRIEVQNTLDDIFPQLKGQWSNTLTASTISGYGFDNDAAALVGKQQAAALLDTAQSLATALVGTPLASLLPCSSAGDRACADQFLTKFGRRLFRRTLTSAERDQYLAFFDSAKGKSDFKSALKWMAVGLLQSPKAIYRSEIGETQGDGSRALTPHEIATELAYTFSSTTPSEDLLARADSGDLGDPSAVARAMLATDAGKAVLQRFFAAYLDIGTVTSIQRPNIMSFSNLTQDMLAESRAFLDDVVIRQGGGLKELLTAPTTNPSRALASYYGFPAPAADFGSVMRPAGRGVGILAQGAFLATHSSADASSPTRRGLFPYRRLYCQPTLTPPPDVPQIAAPQPGQKTTRQRYEEAHVTAGGSCAGCHKLFDPFGFAFEHYDEGGRYRADEGGLPINTAATTAAFGDSPALSFDGQEDLMTKLAEQPVIQQCFAAYLATFAFGSGESCLGASAVPSLQSGAVGIAEAFALLANEPHFTKRDAK